MSVSCEKGQLQIFYSDDMRKHVKHWTKSYGKQDVTHYVYFVKNVNKNAVYMLLTFKDTCILINSWQRIMN
jgi:trehalose-6-phosphate synthase